MATSDTQWLLKDYQSQGNGQEKLLCETLCLSATNNNFLMWSQEAFNLSCSITPNCFCISIKVCAKKETVVANTFTLFCIWTSLAGPTSDDP